METSQTTIQQQPYISNYFQQPQNLQFRFPGVEQKRNKTLIFVGIGLLVLGIVISVGIGVGLYFALKKKKESNGSGGVPSPPPSDDVPSTDTETSPFEIKESAVVLFDPRVKDSFSSQSCPQAPYKYIVFKNQISKENYAESRNLTKNNSVCYENIENFFTIDKSGEYFSIKYPEGGDVSRFEIAFSSSFPSGNSESTMLQWVRFPGDSIKTGLNMQLLRYGNNANRNDARCMALNFDQFYIVCPGNDFSTGFRVKPKEWCLLGYVYDGLRTMIAYFYILSSEDQQVQRKTKQLSEDLKTTLNTVPSIVSGEYNNQDIDIGVSAIYSKSFTDEDIKNFISKTKPK